MWGQDGTCILYSQPNQLLLVTFLFLRLQLGLPVLSIPFIGLHVSYQKHTTICVVLQCLPSHCQCNRFHPSDWACKPCLIILFQKFCKLLLLKICISKCHSYCRNRRISNFFFSCWIVQAYQSTKFCSICIISSLGMSYVINHLPTFCL